MNFSTTGMICRPIFLACIAISMYSSSLKPLQMIGVSLSASAITASSSGFEPASSPKWIGPAVLEDLFDDLALLVHLDREHAAVLALVSVLLNGVLERAVNLAQAMFQNLAEANQNRRMDAAQNQLIHQFLQIDARASVLGRMNPQMPVRRRRRIALSPGVYIVELAASRDGPPFGRFENLGSIQNLYCQL